MKKPKEVPVQHSEPSQPDFRNYLGEKKKTILIAFCVSLVSFVLLKYLYPYPEFFGDSHAYIDWAVRKYAVSYRPTGYSYLLRFLHSISSPAMLTVSVQYLLFLLSTLFCILSADFLFKLPQKLVLPLLILILINPMLLIQVNTISSDSVFSSLTVMWFTLCMWIVKRGNLKLILLQIALLYLCFEVRLTAIFYPVVPVAAILLSAFKPLQKAMAIGLTMLVIYFAIERERNLMEETTGTRVYSAFPGWQIANNALHTYKHIDLDPSDLPSEDLKLLDACVRYFIDSIPIPPGKVVYSFLWNTKSPLKQYAGVMSERTGRPYGKIYVATSELYSEYGWYIIRNFPAEYIQYYLIPNTLLYFYPDREAMTSYCDGATNILPATQEWFELDTQNLSCRLPELHENIIMAFPPISTLLNIFNIGTVIYFFARASRKRKALPRGIWQFSMIWSVYYFLFIAFTIFATAVNLRFMTPIFVLGFIAPFVLLHNIPRKSTERKMAE